MRPRDPTASLTQAEIKKAIAVLPRSGAGPMVFRTVPVDAARPTFSRPLPRLAPVGRDAAHCTGQKVQDVNMVRALAASVQPSLKGVLREIVGLDPSCRHKARATL